MTERRKAGEQGGSRISFLIIMAIIACVGYCGYLYVPVAYQAYLLKDLMQHNVDVAVAQGYAPSWVSDQLRKTGAEYGLPPDAEITPVQKDNRIQVTVQFTKPIAFFGYTYNYEFNQTTQSTAFLSFK